MAAAMVDTDTGYNTRIAVDLTFTLCRLTYEHDRFAFHAVFQAARPRLQAL